MNKTLLIIILSFLPLLASAEQFKTNCVVIAKEQKKEQGKCVIEYDYGAGASWTNILFKGKRYYYEEATSLNDDGAEQTDSYARNAKTLKRLNPKTTSDKEWDRAYFCHKMDKNRDICYQVKN